MSWLISRILHCVSYSCFTFILLNFRHKKFCRRVSSKAGTSLLLITMRWILLSKRKLIYMSHVKWFFLSHMSSLLSHMLKVIACFHTQVFYRKAHYQNCLLSIFPSLGLLFLLRFSSSYFLPSLASPPLPFLLSALLLSFFLSFVFLPQSLLIWVSTYCLSSSPAVLILVWTVSLWSPFIKGLHPSNAVTVDLYPTPPIRMNLARTALSVR